MAIQLVFEFVRSEPVGDEVLADAAECCLDALHREAQFVAFGPAVAVDLERGVIEVECTVAAEGDTEIDRTATRIREIALAAFARSEYRATVSIRDALPA